MAAGQRPITNVVDITNYVMLLTGQPLHAFDLDRVAGGGSSCAARTDGEQIDTLDGQTRTLDADVFVIDDADGPDVARRRHGRRALGGARRHDARADGGRDLARAEDPRAPRTRLGLRSEASARFEKGLAPEQTMEAQAVATQLMVELSARGLVPGTIDVGGAGRRPAQVIRLRDATRRAAARRRRSRAGAAALNLRRSASASADAADGLDVSVPHFRRNDVTREADLVEEVARIDGLDEAARDAARRARRRSAADAAAARAPPRRGRARRPRPARDRRLVVHRARRRRPPAPARRRPAPPRRRAREPDERGPVGPAHDAPRLAARRRAPQRRARRTATSALFETRRESTSTTGDGTLPLEHHALGAARALADVARGEPGGLLRRQGAPRRGARHAARRRGTSRRRGRSRSCIPGRGARGRARARPSSAGSARCTRSSRARGTSTAVAAFEIDLGAVAIAQRRGRPRYADLTTFPRAARGPRGRRRRRRAGGDACVDVVRAAGGALLARAEVFDVYRGEQVGEGRTSLALALTFRAPDRTLTDEEVAPVREKIVARAARRAGGELRG